MQTLYEAISNSNRKYDTVIFDLDGTLVDTFPGITDSISFVLQTALPDIDVFVPRDVIGPPPVREIFKQLVPKLGDDELDSLTAHFQGRYRAIGRKKSSPFPEVEATLLGLREIRITCFVVTNKPMIHTKNIVSNLGWNCFFEAIVTPDCREPHFASKKEMMDDLIRSNKLDRANVVMVGDSLDDAEAAYNSKIKFVGVSYGYGVLDENMPYPMYQRISNMSELLSIVN
ncbi:5'-nucleotidase [subsurface metagenome]